MMRWTHPSDVVLGIIFLYLADYLLILYTLQSHENLDKSHWAAVSSSAKLLRSSLRYSLVQILVKPDIGNF